MPKFAANLTLMYTEHAFLDRFAAAAADGFEAVEFMFPYAFAPIEIAARLRDSNLQQILFNAPPGDWDSGERGLASLPDRIDEFRLGIDRALDYAAQLGTRLLHVMAGLIGPQQSHALHAQIYQANLIYAAQRAALHGVTIVIEPINPRDMPGYFLQRQADAYALCEQIDLPNLRMLFDLYHCQVSEGDLATNMTRHIDRIGHMQIAGAPQRQEPDLGEIHYPYLFELSAQLGYQGWIGCEYRPRGATSAGLGWLQRWRD